MITITIFRSEDSFGHVETLYNPKLGTCWASLVLDCPQSTYSCHQPPSLLMAAPGRAEAEFVPTE